MLLIGKNWLTTRVIEIIDVIVYGDSQIQIPGTTCYTL